MIKHRKGFSNYMSIIIFMTLAILFAALYYGSISGWWDQAIQQFITTADQNAVQ